MSWLAFAAIGLSALIGRSNRKKRKHSLPHLPPPQPIPHETVHEYSEGPRLSDLTVQHSSYGKNIPLVYGTVRIAGNVIWSRPISEHESPSTKQKSSTYRTTITHRTDYKYTVTLAVALCEGTITNVLRVWADSKQLDLSQLDYSIHLGDEEQMPDETIIHFEGRAPAYRDLAYVVIKNFPLADYHNKIPNFTFEVRRYFHGEKKPLENKITEIVFGQGVGEYLYDTIVHEQARGSWSGGQFHQMGAATKLNQNNSSNKADALVALDDMKQVLPVLKYVSLPVYWALNIKDGAIEPCINLLAAIDDSSPERITPGGWISNTKYFRVGGFGSPCDASILRIVQEIKSRGYKVMVCPKLIAYDPDKGALLENEIGPGEVNFKLSDKAHAKFIIHYASLLKGHIDAFVIGSSPISSRMAMNSVHMAHLKQLAATVKSILPNAQIVFSAFSQLYHSSRGLYYLDDLWSDSNIDIIGIEAYFSLTESSTTYDQVFAGWKSKDINSWWSTVHTNPDGKTTSWKPKMKPIWITEIGFGSVDNCSNEPDVFSRPHNTRYPKGSKGREDFAAQRAALQASLDYLRSVKCIEKVFVKYWDNRPYPFYPLLKDKWDLPYTWEKDASLQGKLGLITLGNIVEDLLKQVGLNSCETSQLHDAVLGFVISARQSVRASLEQLASAFFFDAVESQGILTFAKRGAVSSATIDSREFIVPDDGDPDDLIITRVPELELPRTVNVLYINSAQNYETGSVNAQRQTVNALNSTSINLPIVLSARDAQRIAEVTLLQTWITRTQYKFTLPPKYMHLKPTDVITVRKHVEHESDETTRSGIAHEHIMRILSVKLMPNGVQEICACSEDISSYERYEERNETGRAFTLSYPTPKTKLVLLDLPTIFEDKGACIHYAAVGVTRGWRGADIYIATDDDHYWDYQLQLTKQATLGTVVDFKTDDADPNIWDKHTTVDVVLMHGELSSVTELQVLSGSNLCVIGDEVLQFQYATMLDDYKYRLHKLLRGRKGTEHAINTHGPNEHFVLLNDAVVSSQVAIHLWGASLQYKAVTFGDRISNTESVEFTYNARALKPYAPSHIRATRNMSGDIIMSWKRRARINGNWLNQVDVPLSEESQAYEIDIMKEDGTVIRSITLLVSPVATYTAAEQIADFGELKTKVSVKIYQLSALVGRGYAGTAII